MSFELKFFRIIYYVKNLLFYNNCMLMRYGSFVYVELLLLECIWISFV